MRSNHSCFALHSTLLPKLRPACKSLFSCLPVVPHSHCNGLSFSPSLRARALAVTPSRPSRDRVSFLFDPLGDKVSHFFNRAHARDRTAFSLRRLFSTNSRGQGPRFLNHRGRPFGSWLSDTPRAKEGFNRWWSVPPALITQLSVGSIYAWSTFNSSLTKEIGVVAASASDWNLTSILPVFSTTCVSFGLTAAFAGPWVERLGPRMIGLLAAGCWGGGLTLASLAVHFHNLPLLYLGYGVIGGAGAGLGYIAPVATLLKWFPDKRGLATGMAIMGFGGGAFCGAPMNELLLSFYAVKPAFLGATEAVSTVLTETGTLAVRDGARTMEVVVATASDLRGTVTTPGVFVCGTGNTGVSKTFLTLGCGYFSAMLLSALSVRLPLEGPKEKVLAPTPIPSFFALAQLPQFWLLWFGFLCNTFAGVTILSSAKLLMTDMFSARVPGLAQGLLAASFVSWLSVMNMSGRLGWSALSDLAGRRAMFVVFGSGALVCGAMPSFISAVDTHPTVSMCGFVVGSSILISFFGGYSAMLPAFLADLFPKNAVSTVHGYMLTAWSTAAVCGPILIAQLRAQAYNSYCESLAKVVDPAVFQQTFGGPVSDLPSLIAAKTVTIPRLLELAPAGTIDPTPFLYNPSLYTMAGFLAIGLVLNLRIKPIQHFNP